MKAPRQTSNALSVRDVRGFPEGNGMLEDTTAKGYEETRAKKRMERLKALHEETQKDLENRHLLPGVQFAVDAYVNDSFIRRQMRSCSRGR
jgi:hypothetical protein